MTFVQETAGNVARRETVHSRRLDVFLLHRGNYPGVSRCDNGPELACHAMADWADGQLGLHFHLARRAVALQLRRSFNSRIRDECLNIDSFWSLAQARVVIGD